MPKGLPIVLRSLGGMLLLLVFATVEVVVAGEGQEAPRLRVTGEVGRALDLDAEALMALPRRTVRVLDSLGDESEYEGVALDVLLARAGVPVGEGLRGEMLELYAVVEASDGYRVVFSLPDLDPEFSGRVVLLADRRDGESLAVPEGPLRIIIPGDKRGARQVRMVTRIVLRRDRADSPSNAAPGPFPVEETP